MTSQIDSFESKIDTFMRRLGQYPMAVVAPPTPNELIEEACVESGNEGAVFKPMDRAIRAGVPSALAAKFMSDGTRAEQVRESRWNAALEDIGRRIGTQTDGGKYDVVATVPFEVHEDVCESLEELGYQVFSHSSFYDHLTRGTRTELQVCW